MAAALTAFLEIFFFASVLLDASFARRAARVFARARARCSIQQTYKTVSEPH